MQSEDKQLNTLFFDIETKPLKAYVWDCGEQYIRHGQLVPGHDQFDIICIGYSWNDEKTVHSLDWGYKKQDSSKMIKEFDRIASKADIVIGKNSNKFDIKMINTVRMLKGLPQFPEWAYVKDDLEVQMRRHFRLPSQSLDYISHQLGLGGKRKMEFQDWIDIVEKNANGVKSFHKMINYCKKDVMDTKKLWYYLSKYMITNTNHNAFRAHNKEDLPVCRTCGNVSLTRNGTRVINGTRYQRFACAEGCYAGMAPINSKGGLGKMR